MKRKLLNRSFLKQTALALPAAALMLGAAHAGTTVGLNFQSWYYDSGATPQTIGFGNGYQTTGFPVTAKAFGVPVADWSNTDPLSCGNGGAGIPISTTIPFGGGLSANVSAPNAWESAIGEQVAGWHPETVAPGNNEVTWSYLDSGYGGGGAAGKAPSVSVSGLAAKFPNGYVVQTIAANSGVKIFNDVDITDGVTTNTVAYATYYVTGPASDGYYSGSGTVGLSAPSGVFTSDTIHINPQAQTAGERSVLAGFIITDQPVASTPAPSPALIPPGGTISLSAGVVGVLPSYQWRTNGVAIPGATAATYTKTGATSSDSASYDVVVTNPYGSVTNGAALVTVDLPTPTTWGTSVTVAGDTDVSTAGTAVFAYDWNSSTQTVNGVSFTAPGSGVTESGFTGGNYHGFLIGTASPATDLSTAYQNVLTGGDYNNGGPAMVTLNNLTPGHQYQVQFWVDDSRQLNQTRTETVTSGGNTVTLSYPGDTLGGLGQYSIGTFTANFVNQVVTLIGSSSTGGGSSQINALQLRDLGLPLVTATPVFSLPSGSYLGAPSVAVSSGSGSTVYYTIDGTTPTTSSPHGASPVLVNLGAPATTTIQAYGTHSGESDSAVVSATYHTYTTPAVPTWINTAGGSWPEAGNWSNNVVAGGASVTADFSALTLPGDAFVTLDSSPTVGSLVFGDKGNLYNWEIDAGSGGTLTLAATNTPTITVVNQTATINTALAVPGAAGLAKTGNGTLTLAGTGISYTSPTTVNGGTLVFLDNGNASGNAPVTSIALTNNSAITFTSSGAGAASDFRGNIAGAGSLTINGPGAVRFGPWGSVVQITLTGDVVVASSGTLQVAGRSNYQMFNTPGSLVVSDGALVTWNALNDQSASTASTFGALLGNGTLSGDYGTPYAQFGKGDASGTFSGVIQNSLSITKIGSGTQILTGANTYTGTTTVSNGTLQVDGSLSGIGSVIVAGGTLRGTGYITGGVTVNAGGTLAPGDASGLGSLSLYTTLVFNAGGTNLMRLNKTGANLTSDTVQGLTSVTYGGTLALAATGDAIANGDSFVLFPSAGSYQGAFAAYNLPPLAAGLSWDVSQLTVNGSVSVGNAIAPVTFSPVAGGYLGEQVVTITCLTPGATIYYTTNGSTPTTSSPSGPSGVTVTVPVNTTRTIQAFAHASGFADSLVVSATYTTEAEAIWSNPSGGSWADPNNWALNIIANSSDAAADFSTLTLPGDTYVTLDSSPTVGSLVFGDKGNLYNWEIDAGNGGTLTLAATNPSTINVVNRTAILNTAVAVAGTNALIKTGNGTLTLAGTGIHYTSPTLVNAGTLVFMDNGNGQFDAPVTSVTLTNNSALMFTSSSSTVASDFRGNISGTGTLTVDGAGTVRFGPWGSVVRVTLTGNVVVASGGLQVAGRSDYQMFNTPGNLIVSNAALVSWTALNDQSANTASTFGALIGDGVVSGDYGTPHARFGNGDASGTFTGVIQNLMFITKIGSGTQILTGTNTYSGTTTVSGGTLGVDGSLGTNTVTVAGGTLGGTGTINGPVIVNSGGTLSAGVASIGTLTIANTLTFNTGSTAMLKLDKAGATHDLLAGISTLTYGGTLTVTNLAGTLALGDSFQLFNATTYNGNFAAMNLPALGAGLVWSWTPANGTLTVIHGETPPVLSGFGPLTGSSFPLTFSGPNGQTYKVLASTNVALPLASWMELTNGTFGASAVTYTDTAATNMARFYRIVSP